MLVSVLSLVLSRFHVEFGTAPSTTKKVSRWTLAPWLDVIVQQDVGVNFAEVWLTDSSTATAILPTAERVPAGIGRHSNTYWRTLDRRYSALRMRVTNELQLRMLIDALRT